MASENSLLAQYQRDGIVTPLQGLSEFEVRRAYQQYLELCGPGKVVAEGEDRVFGHLLHTWIAQLVSHPAILESVRAIIGPDVLVWVSEFNAKAPNTANFFSWHQDLYYWKHTCGDLESIPMVTAWLALSPVNEGNGCMKVVPGSHTGLIDHEEKPCLHNSLTRAQELKVAVDESTAMPVLLKAGEFSIHHPLIYHCSGPNSSDQTRVGLVIRYMAPQVVPPTRPAYAWLVSGEDSCGNWDHVAPSNDVLGRALKKKSMQSVQRVTGARFK